MALLHWLWNFYWNWLLEWPIAIVSSLTGWTMAPGLAIVIKLILSLVVLYLLYSAALGVKKRIKRIFSRSSASDLYSRADAAALAAQARAQGEDIDPQLARAAAAAELETSIAQLKRAKDYAGLAKLHAAAGQYKGAAKWFQKAGMRREAAHAWGKAGKPLKAARMLEKEGDFEGAARYYAEKGNDLKAAQALTQAKKLAGAGAAYMRAGKVAEAVDAYLEYFQNPRDDVQQQVKAAEDCLKMLEERKAEVAAQHRKALLPALAARFEQAKRHEFAARLFCEAGDFGRAGEVYLLAGKLEEASKCMEQAGRKKDASQILGRFRESQGKWAEAAMAYVQAGEMLRAGECYSRSGQAARAAECFEKAKEYFRSGVAYAHAARWEDGIRVLQKVDEANPSFDQSRALLGRCFYEMHDYAHCAAALENHLTGKRVSTSNLDEHYMLSLAYEQQGKLGQARELLYKIRSVDVNFRDVSHRISNISSRISMQSELNQSVASSAGTAAPGAAGGQGMSAVENTLGGRYQLVKELGRGGMGVVYLAKDAQLDRMVALKFLGSLADGSEEYRNRFIREARTAAKISHPNIISIYDISASAGKAYIAMEYVEGPSLFKYLRAKKQLIPKEAVNIIGQACSALAAIHDAGIVHRDIKPENIMIAKGGLVKLMDFGLAKAEDNRMTRTGVVMGTPSYMAPEQVKGRDASPRSDIYAIGLVLHECLTGQTVFRDGNVLERQLEETPPPPGKTAEGVPAELDQVVMKCIEKDPERRYASAKELLAALRALGL